MPFCVDGRSRGVFPRTRETRGPGVGQLSAYRGTSRGPGARPTLSTHKCESPKGGALAYAGVWRFIFRLSLLKELTGLSLSTTLLV